MPLSFVQKKAVVEALHTSLSEAKAVIAADACGLTAAESGELRVRIRAAGGRTQIVPNRLALRAIEGTPYSCLGALCKGPTMFAWSTDDPVSLANALDKFEAENLQLKGISFGTDLLDASEVKKVAALPSREQALAQLASVLQAPVTKLAIALSGVPRNLALVLAAVKAQKESS
ncbi:MAG: 50S ribosomal protein L10 [Gammaproteobacteria bacterium]